MCPLCDGLTHTIRGTCNVTGCESHCFSRSSKKTDYWRQRRLKQTELHILQHFMLLSWQVVDHWKGVEYTDILQSFCTIALYLWTHFKSVTLCLDRKPMI